MSRRSRDPVDKFLLSLINDDEPYMNQYMRLRRNKRKVPPDVVDELNAICERLRRELT